MGMKFEKKALTIPEQIALLESRGMVIEDKAKAAHYLTNISYYRLSAYWYTFLENPKENHKFIKGATFQKTIDTYVFDRKLRLLIFDEIERIEIALRTQIIYHFCHEHGKNWYEEKHLFRQPEYCFKFLVIVQDEMKRTNEVFIRHYNHKYSDPIFPPAWMALELVSIGQLSTLYKNLRMGNAKKQVAAHFNIHENVLTSWLETLSYIRNACAHHSRLWNRKIPKSPMLPETTKDTWLKNLPEPEYRNRMYVVLATITYLLKSIVPDSNFKTKLASLITEYPDIPIAYMGFPKEWKNEDLWNK